MNYCEHHLGDYARRAMHFDMMAHGAYALLRDRYFVTEAAIPQADANKVCRAKTPAERAAVADVLAEFFELIDGHWVCREFDAQLSQAKAKITAARENGKRGGRPKQTEKKPSGLSPGSDSVTQAKAHQSPDTNTQYPSMERGEDSTTVGGHDDPSPHAGPEDDPPPEPSLAGRACLAMRGAGVTGVNPSHPDLLRLLAAGVTPTELGSTAAECVERGKAGMAYVLRVVEGRRHDAAAAPSSLPQRGRADPGVTVDAAESSAEYTARMQREAQQRAADDAQRNTPEAIAARRAAAERLRGLAAHLTRGAAA